MANPVVKLAQPGFDVLTAGDENLIYSSKWPLLEIYKQDTATLIANQNSVITTHDLGFPPVFFYFANVPESAWQNFGPVGFKRRAEFFGTIGGGTLGCDEGQITHTRQAGGSTTGQVQFYYYIFALDLSVQYDAPIIKVGSISGGNDGDFVFKIAKEGKDVDSNDLSDFVLHSRARSPLIHSVNPTPGAVKDFVVRHNLGYNPMFFAYQKLNGKYTMIPTGVGGTTSLSSDENKITFQDSGAKELSIVILKDPFLIDYSVRVNV